ALDGPIRPAQRLGQGLPLALRLQQRHAWVLSPSVLASGNTRSAVELFEKSRQGSVAQGDLTDPAAPVVLGGSSIPPPYDPKAFAVRGNFVYVVADAPHFELFDVTGEDGPSLLTIDATDATGPKLVSAIPFAGKARGIELVDDLAVVAAGT